MASASDDMAYYSNFMVLVNAMRLKLDSTNSFNIPLMVAALDTYATLRHSRRQTQRIRET